MAAWLLWLIAGLILISAEVLSGDLWLLMIGLGAFGGAAAAGLGGNLVLSAIVFAIASVALVGGLRPMLKRRLLAGQVKIGGEIWSARAHSPDDRLGEPGAPVIVMQISGATAIVAPEP